MLNSSSTGVSKYFLKKFCGVLRDLVQFKKREKHLWGVLLYVRMRESRTRKTPNMDTFHVVKCLSVLKYAAFRCHKTLLVFTVELSLGKFWIKWSKNKFSSMQLILVQELLGKRLDISKPINKHIAWMKVELKVWHLWSEFLCSCHRAFLYILLQKLY